jgi:hypothetical protein
VTTHAQQPAEATASTPPTVVAGLGFPNGRAEVSTEPTGWHASQIGADGAPISSFTTSVIDASNPTK